jgi:hypothetical protein
LNTANLPMYEYDAEIEAARKVTPMLGPGDRENQMLRTPIRRAIVALRAAPAGPTH